MEDISNVDHRHANNVLKKFKLKHLGEYHELYVQSDTLRLYELDPAQFLTKPGLAWQACLKKSGVELELLTNPDMLPMVENGIRSRICEAKLHYAEANNVYMKHRDKSKESSYLQYYDANSLHVDDFKFKKDILKFAKDFIINYDEHRDKEYILEVDVEYPKNLHDLHSNLPFLPEKMRNNKCSKLVCNLYDKKKLCCSYNITETSIKSWINIKKFS